MNLSKLQSEAVKELEKLYREERMGIPEKHYVKIEVLLSDQIKKAVKKTRKGMIKQIRKMETSSYTLDGAYLNENIDFICKKLKKLSLNPKENNK